MEKSIFNKSKFQYIWPYKSDYKDMECPFATSEPLYNTHPYQIYNWVPKIGFQL